MQGVVGVIRPLQQVAEEVEQRPTWTDIDVKVAAINRLFGAPRLRERCDAYVRGVYRDTYDNRKAKKALRNQLFAFLRQEMDVVRSSIQVHQFITRKRAAMRRARPAVLGPRAPTAYATFCRRMHETRPHGEIVGRLQELWRQERNLPSKERKRERYARPAQQGAAQPEHGVGAQEPDERDGADEVEREAEQAAVDPHDHGVYPRVVYSSDDSDSTHSGDDHDYR